MGQRLARHYMDDGVRLYHVQRRANAVAKWHNALARLRRPEDRFITMGYLAQAYCEVGDYARMLAYAMQQIDLANRCDDQYMKAEAYLNLGRASERLADYNKAIAYARQSVQHRSLDPRTAGYAYACVAQSYLGFGLFPSALEHFELAMQVATATKDYLLELQVCVGLGGLFTQLRDLRKALVFLQNAVALLKTVTLADVAAKYRAIVLCQLAVTLRKSGALADARAAAEEALTLAADNGHLPVQARCLHALGDIHFALGEKHLAVEHYERAYESVRALNDRPAQLAMLASMAKAAAAARAADDRHCECHALQLNKRCLELARELGARLEMLKCHARLAALYRQLQDAESESVARGAVATLTQQLDLFCDFCGRRYGRHDEPLQALACSHLFHQACLERQYTPRQQKTCPKCCAAASRPVADSSTSSAAQSVSGYESAPPTAGRYLVCDRWPMDAAAGRNSAPTVDCGGRLWQATQGDTMGQPMVVDVSSPSGSAAGSGRSTTPNPALKDVFPYDAPSVVSISLSETPRRDAGRSNALSGAGTAMSRQVGAEDGERTPVAARRDAETAAASLRAAASILADELDGAECRRRGSMGPPAFAYEPYDEYACQPAAYAPRLTQARSEYAVASSSEPTDSDQTNAGDRRRWLGATNPDAHHHVVALAEQRALAIRMEGRRQPPAPPLRGTGAAARRASKQRTRSVPPCDQQNAGEPAQPLANGPLQPTEV